MPVRTTLLPRPAAAERDSPPATRDARPEALARGCSRSDPAPATTPSTSRGGLSQTAPWRSWTSSRRCSTTPCAEHTHWASRTSSRAGRCPGATLPGRLLRRRLLGRHPRRGPRQGARVVRAASRTQARRAAGGRGGLARPPQGFSGGLRRPGDNSRHYHKRTHEGTLGYFAAFQNSLGDDPPARRASKG